MKDTLEEIFGEFKVVIN